MSVKINDSNFYVIVDLGGGMCFTECFLFVSLNHCIRKMERTQATVLPLTIELSPLEHDVTSGHVAVLSFSYYIS